MQVSPKPDLLTEDQNVLVPMVQAKAQNGKIESVAETSCFSTIGLYSQKPLGWGVHKFAQLFNRNSIVTKIIAIFFAVIVVLPLAAIAGIGTLLWAVGPSRPLFQFSSHAPQALPSAPLTPLSSRKLTVLTWNVGMGPDYMSEFNDLPPPYRRVDAIAGQILNQNADIVCLQEVFDEPSEQKLVEALTAAGYDCLHSALPSKIKLSTGLLVAVRRDPEYRFEIDKIAVWHYNNMVTIDKGANKGLIGLKLKANIRGKTESLYVFNTHMQADYTGTNYESTRTDQVKSMVSRMQEFIGKRSRRRRPLVVACGDLNFSRKDNKEEYRNQARNLCSVVRNVNPEGAAIDYVMFGKRHSRKDIAHKKVAVDSTVSDHNMLVGTLDL